MNAEWGCGCRWIQREGAPIEEVRPGDVVGFALGEKHWHSATAMTVMTNIAIQERDNGTVGEWMEHVAEEQFRKG
jgi:quercetin dioxygenase-like cupin family protein